MKIDLADLSGPLAGIAFLRRSIAKALDEDVFKNAKTAIVKVAPAPIRNADTDDVLILAPTGSSPPAEGSIPQETRFRFYGYIEKIDDIDVKPNAFYEDVCDPSYTGDSDAAAKVIANYTQFESTYKALPPKPRDRVKVTLATSADYPTWNQQFGYFEGLETIEDAGKVVVQSQACTALSKMDWAQAASGEAAEIAQLAAMGKKVPNYTARTLCPKNETNKANVETLARAVGIEYKTALAIMQVEAGGANVGPKLRFERHWFLGYGGPRRDMAGKERADLRSHWTYRGGKPPGSKMGDADYQDGSGDKADFEKAFKLDPVAAIMATSWGRFQVMGAYMTKSDDPILKNAVTTEEGAKEFWKKYEAEGNAMGDKLMILWFKKIKPTAAAVATNCAASGDWRPFATLYNGSGCCTITNGKWYHLKLKSAYQGAVEKCEPKTPPAT